MEGSVAEAIGAPITGSGIERCERSFGAGPMALEPGGLALSMQFSGGPGTLQLQRGHLPRSAANGAQSIARWYEIASVALIGEPISYELRFDPTELNGLQASLLAAHAAEVSSGPWTGLATIAGPGPNTLSFSTLGSGQFLTAFDPDQVTSLADLSDGTDLRIWPTLANDVVHIMPLDGSSVFEVEVIDLQGRRWYGHSWPSGTAGVVEVPVGTLPPGCYCVRVDRHAVKRFVKP
jgi:hypothetical protein